MEINQDLNKPVDDNSLDTISMKEPQEQHPAILCRLDCHERRATVSAIDAQLRRRDHGHLPFRC